MKTTARTFDEIVLSDQMRDAIAQDLAAFPDPTIDVDDAITQLRRIFCGLPIEQARAVLDFGRHVDAPGVMLVHNLPEDPRLPPTPHDGNPSEKKKTFVAEGVLLGLSQLLGEPVGFLTEKSGRLVHDVVPVDRGSASQTNQSSAVFLNFHNDIVHDDDGRYDVPNPDFLVLNCLRSDATQQAVTYYADARDISRRLAPRDLATLRAPVFRLNAPGSYIRDVAGGAQVLARPAPLISGPANSPEIAVSANGVETQNDEAEAALHELQEACRAVAHQVRLVPGTALLINNRKGLHARSSFPAWHDGRDRWLQRTYIRRSIWDLRHRRSARDRRMH
jgi:L-asparagine oxygenase